MLSSVLAVLWALCGLIAVLAMLVLLGGKGADAMRPVLRWTHRILGGIFSLGYVGFLVLMIPKYRANAPLLPSPLTVHAYLGVALFPLLLVKHLVVRMFKKYYPALPYLGVIIFVIAFTLVGMTGGHNALLWAKGPKATVKAGDGQREVSVALGRDLLHSKCARCHRLRPTYIYRKSEDEWRQTVDRMRGKDRGLITSDQADHIVGFLAAELGEASDK